MVNRRQIAYALITTLAVVLCCTSLIGVEFSLVSERLNDFKGYYQRAATTSPSSDAPAKDSAAKQDEDQTLKNLRAVASGSQANESSEASGSLEATVKDAQPHTDAGQYDQALTPHATNASIPLNSSAPSEAGGTLEQDVRLNELPPGSGDQKASNTSAESEAVDALDQDTTLDKQASAAGDQKAGNSTARSEGSALDDAAVVNSADEDGVSEEPATEPTALAKKQQQPNEYDLDELMTPELIEQIASQASDCLDPVHVHLLWIGDINKAPRSRHKYSDMGYKLTVHTSAEEVLEGFHPYVLEAFKLAVPNVVGFDFLKFAMLYRYGGFAVDADTTPVIQESQLQWPADCDVVFGKELKNTKWNKPVFLNKPHGAYDMNRPFQILNWAMAVNKPRNPHVKQLLMGAMMHFFGRRDMEQTLIQDVSGSGLMSDYVALLHEREGRSFPDVYRDESKYVPVQGMCLTDGYLYGKWIHHDFLNSWRQQGAH